MRCGFPGPGNGLWSTMRDGRSASGTPPYAEGPIGERIRGMNMRVDALCRDRRTACEFLGVQDSVRYAADMRDASSVA